MIKGYMFPEIRTEIDKNELTNKAISEFAVCTVYSNGQYIGYVNTFMQFISSVDKSKSTSAIIHAKKLGICIIGLYFGLLISVAFVIIFSILLVKTFIYKK